MPGWIHPNLFSKTKTCTLVSTLVCLSFYVHHAQPAFAWPAVLPQAPVLDDADKSQIKSQDKSQDKLSSRLGESRLTKGIQKTIAEGHYRLGLRLKKKKQSEEALTQFLEATNKNPNHFKSFFEQALIYRQKQIHDLAVTCLQQALTIKPKYKDARVLLATLQLEKGNVGQAFEQLKESLGMQSDVKSDEDLSRGSDTILQTIHTFIETSQVVASVIAPSLVPALVYTPSPSQIQKSETAPVKEVIVQEEKTPTLLAQQAILVPVEAADLSKSKSNSSSNSKSKSKSKSEIIAKSSKAVVKIPPKPDEDEWTRKLRYLAKNGTGTLKAGEAFFFAEDTGEAILILADGKRIVRTVDAAKDREEVVQMRRPDILVPDDLLYNLSLLGKVVADKVTSPLDAPGSMGDKPSASMSGYAGQATRQASETSMQEKSPPSFKLESERNRNSDSLNDSLEPRRMVHWLKDVFHM